MTTETVHAYFIKPGDFIWNEAKDSSIRWVKVKTVTYLPNETICNLLGVVEIATLWNTFRKHSQEPVNRRIDD